MNMKLLIVDDDLPFRERLTRSMEKKGFEVVSSPGFKDSLLKVTEKNFDYAVVDMRLEDGSGLELVKEFQKISPQTKSLLLTGYGNIATAVAIFPYPVSKSDLVLGLIFWISFTNSRPEPSSNRISTTA